MIKTPSNLQDLRRRLYVKAKSEPSWRFWGLYVHVCKRETLFEAYRLAKANDGAPGIDGVTFEAIEADGLRVFLSNSARGTDKLTSSDKSNLADFHQATAAFHSLNALILRFR